MTQRDLVIDLSLDRLTLFRREMEVERWSSWFSGGFTGVCVALTGYMAVSLSWLIWMPALLAYAGFKATREGRRKYWTLRYFAIPAEQEFLTSIITKGGH